MNYRICFYPPPQKDPSGSAGVNVKRDSAIALSGVEGATLDFRCIGTEEKVSRPCCLN